MVRDTTLAHKGLTPSSFYYYLSIDKDAHAGHTQKIKKHRAFGGKFNVLWLPVGTAKSPI